MKLVVFFTRGMSIEAWHRAGILERELALYRELSSAIGRLAFVTYGSSADLQWATVLPNIEILPNRWGIATNLYSVIAPWLHRKSLRDASILRTNQLNGAWCAVIAKIWFRKPLVVRCGYLWSDSVARLKASRWRQTMAILIERLVVRAADSIVVVSEADEGTMVRRYGVRRNRINVIPNYVDTSLFRPMPEIASERGRIIFVGRLEPEKNVESLLEAIRGIPEVRLTVIGDGALREALEAKARANGVEVKFLGRVPNAKLPELLQRSEVFILPSHYEGNPKALTEAMACGIPVIGTRVPGICEVVTHRESGFLCGTSAAEIRSALLEVLNDAPLRARLGEGGLRYVRERCSLAIAAKHERAVLKSLV